MDQSILELCIGVSTDKCVIGLLSFHHHGGRRSAADGAPTRVTFPRRELQELMLVTSRVDEKCLVYRNVEQ